MTEVPPARDAATVMLVRDGDAGVEVFMVRRSKVGAFGGLYVFPGGTVDPADRHDDIGEVCDGLDDARASALLGVEGGGLAFWVAAVRECFEEAGVLLAHDASGRTVSFADPALAGRFEAERRAVHDGSRRLVELCRAEGLRLSLGHVFYVSHWITPVVEPKRFDTRFFVAEAPPDQTPLHDDHELVESVWLRPSDALARQQAGELAMLPPTISNLRFLAPSATVADVLARSAAVGVPPTIFPTVERTADGAVVVRAGGAGDFDAGALGR